MSKYRKLSFLSLAVLAMLAVSIPAGATTYYWNGSRSIDYITVANWWTNSNFTGTHPTLAELTNTGGGATCFTSNANSIRLTNATLAASGTQNFDATLNIGVKPTSSDTGWPWNSAWLNNPETCVESGNSNCIYYFRDLRLNRGYMTGYQTNGRHWTGNVLINGPYQWQVRNGQTFYVDAAVDAAGEPNMYIMPYRPSNSGYPSTANLNWGPSECWFFGKWVIRGKIIGTTAGAFGESDVQLYGIYPGGSGYDDAAGKQPGTIQITNADAISTNARVDMMTSVYGTASTPMVSQIATNLAVTIRWATMNGTDIPAGTYDSATSVQSNGKAWVSGSGSVTITRATQRNLTMACAEPNSRTYPAIGSTRAYVEGRVVRIKAVNDATSPWVFDYWSSSTGSGIASTTSASTTVTIPTGSDITVTAHYKASAGSPVPTTGAGNVSVFAGLAWTPVASGVTTQYVYFGTVNPPTSLSPVASGGASLNSVTNAQLSGPLADNTIYYWTVQTNGIAGSVWSFTTGSGTPHNPVPSDTATEIDADTTMAWVADSAATSYDVYLSTNQTLVSGSDPSVKTTATSASLPVTGLARGVYYYWKVVANYPDSITKVGPVWSFRVKTYKLYLKTGSTTVAPTYSIDGAADVNGILDDANMAVYKFSSVDYNSQWDIVVTGSKGAAVWSDGDIAVGGVLSVSAPSDVSGSTAGTPVAGGYIGQAKAADATPWADVTLSGPGRGTKKINTWPGGGGAGYGGIGGDYGYKDTTGGWGGVAYGEQQLYTLWGGSGGGAGLECPGGSGGGIVELYAKGNITVDTSAAVKSNGGRALAVSRTGSGGGSGGSVRLVAVGNIGVAGTVTANGGAGSDISGGGNQGGGGGAGGRVALYHGGSLAVTGTVTAIGGLRGVVSSTAATDGAAGTVYTAGNTATLLAANNQYPANNAVGVSVIDPNFACVAWNPGIGSTANTLYIGTSSTSMTAVATYTNANGLRLRKVYHPALAEATQYYWRVDTDGVTGAVMTFRTHGQEALNPSPADGATGVDVHNPRLSWQMYSTSGTKWEVYFGTSSTSLTLKKTITDPNALVMYYDAGELLASKTYYWRVDETSSKKWTGFVWSFTTRDATCAAADRPMADLSGDCRVTFLDVALLASGWRICNLYPASDCQ
jgi:hypothetical protein